jgi:hypothetical protein
MVVVIYANDYDNYEGLIDMEEQENGCENI